MQARTDLETSVLRTVLWFSQFSYPLTAFEIWKWLLLPERAYGLGEVYGVLERGEWLAVKLESRDGFWALRGEGIEELVAARQERFLDAERKFKRLRRAAMWFRLLPSVRAVAACNTMAWWSTTLQSDIDLYIVTHTGTIWSSRFWLVLPFALFGRRPQARAKEDPFCFSFFSTQDALDMETLCVPRDVYMAYWVRSLVPVFDRDGHLEALQQENRWVSRSLPNAHSRSPHYRHAPRRLAGAPLPLSAAEPFMRWIQRRRLPDRLREMANLDTRVVVHDDRLKFHENDRREAFRDRFEDLCKTHL